MMKYIFTILLFSIFLIACNQAVTKPEEKNDNKKIEGSGISFSTEGKKSTIYTTASNTNLRMEKSETLVFEPTGQPLESEVSIFVNSHKIFQTFLGIGGAITDASAEIFAKLPADKQKELLEAYYDTEKGIGYSLCRTPIHSCDFSNESYTYIEEGDKELKTFSIEHDRQYKIPMIKKKLLMLLVVN